MEQGGERGPRHHAQDTSQPRVPQPVEMVPEAPAVRPQPNTAVPDPLEFFQPRNTEPDVSAYAKLRAEHGDSSSIIWAWMRAAQLPMALWALLPIAVVAGMVWSEQGVVHLDRLLVLGVGVLLAFIGLNLVRGAAHEARTRNQLLPVLTASLAARVGAVCLVLAIIVGLFSTRWTGGTGFVLGSIGLSLGLLYAVLPELLGAFPGDEVIPALTLGPLLFFFALAAFMKTASKGVTPQVPLGSQAHWLLALGLGSLIFAAITATRLRAPEATTGLATRSLVGMRGMRALYASGIALAYFLVVLAGLRTGAFHATIAILLSLPIAIVPLTGVFRARRAEGLAVVQPQTQRLIVWFEGWLLAGFVLSGLYIHVLAHLHPLVGGK